VERVNILLNRKELGTQLTSVFFWSEIRALQMVQKINGNFLRNGCKDSDYILVVYGDCLCKWNCIDGIFREIQYQKKKYSMF
jgi:hypothetical protein